MKRAIAMMLAVLMLAGCATRGANYVPLVDMRYKDAAQFQRDVFECQQYAKTRMDAAEGAAMGAIAGGILGALLSPKGQGGQGSRQGAIIGGVGAGAEANNTQETITKRCLAGRGYNVLN